MAILNRFSAILLYCDSTHFLASRYGLSGDSRPAILGIMRFAVRDSVPLSTSPLHFSRIIISVIITPPITPNNFWGFNKRNSPGKITPSCVVPLRKEHTTELHQNILREFIGAMHFTSVTTENSRGIKCVILMGLMVQSAAESPK